MGILSIIGYVVGLVTNLSLAQQLKLIVGMDMILIVLVTTILIIMTSVIVLSLSYLIFRWIWNKIVGLVASFSKPKV